LTAQSIKRLVESKTRVNLIRVNVEVTEASIPTEHALVCRGGACHVVVLQQRAHVTHATDPIALTMRKQKAMQFRHEAKSNLGFGLCARVHHGMRFNVKGQRAAKPSAAATGYAERRLSKRRWPRHDEAAEVETRRRLRRAGLVD